MASKAEVRRQVFVIGPPAAGSDGDQFRIPFMKGRLVQASSGAFVTDATVENRVVGIRVQDGANNFIYVADSNYEQTASQSFSYFYDLYGTVWNAAEVAKAYIPIRSGGVPVRLGDKVNINAGNQQAGDAFTGTQQFVFEVEED